MNSYRNLTVELADFRQEGGRESLLARVTRSPVGEQSFREATRVEYPEQLRARLTRLQRRRLDLEELIALGEELAALLLPASCRGQYLRSARDFFHRSVDALGSGVNRGAGLRVWVQTSEPQIAELPWEYAYVGRPDTPASAKGYDGFLVLDSRFSLVRCDESPVESEPLSTREAMRLIALFAEVTADPAYVPLDLAQEEVNLLRALDGVGGIEQRILRPGTLDQLVRTLGELDGAEVFHFSGHGEAKREFGITPGTVSLQGRLILADTEGRPAALDAEDLAIRLRHRNIRLAVLMACEAARGDPVTPWRDMASALVRQGLPAVVGMQYTVRDGNAVKFSAEFYRSLATGKSIDAAVSAGRAAIQGRAGPMERDWGVPVLYLRSEDSRLFTKPRWPVFRNLMLAAIVVLTAGYWFSLHILPVFGQWSETAQNWLGLVPPALALLAFLARPIYVLLKKLIWNSEELPVLDWLRAERAQRFLTWACLVALVLFFSTTSVYLRHPGGANPPQQTRIELRTVPQDGRTGEGWSAIPNLVTTADNRLDGGPVFFRPWPKTLVPSLESPEGPWEVLVNDEHNVEQIRPRPWRSLNLSLSRQVYPLIRILPSMKMVQDENYGLAKASEEDPLGVYDLEIMHIGVAGAPGAPVQKLQKIEVPDYRQRALYLGSAGARDKVFGLASSDQRVDRLIEQIRSRSDGLDDCYPLDLEDQWGLLNWKAIWEIEDFHVLEHELAPGQSLKLTLKDQYTGAEEATATMDIGEVIDDLYTVCLNWGGSQP